MEIQGEITLEDTGDGGETPILGGSRGTNCDGRSDGDSRFHVSRGMRPGNNAWKKESSVTSLQLG